MHFARTGLVALLTCLAMVACNDSNLALKQTRDDPDFSVSLHLVPEDQITAKCTALGVPYDANGCSAFNETTKHCDVYVMPQRYQQDEERLVIIGHELWHCRYGQWHD